MQEPLNTYADIDGHELFRRAIVDGDDLAWIEATARYRALLIAWASRCIARTSIKECCEDIADQAIERAWAALSPERFAQFPTLAALLGYLRACVTSAVIDYARSELAAARMAQSIAIGHVPTPEEIALAQSEQRELWRIVSGIAQSEEERVILTSFVYDQRPRAILTQNPHLFTNVAEIYNIKRNLFDKLKRCPELRQLYQQ